MHSPCTKIRYVLTFTSSSLEQFLRAIWGAVSWAIVLTLPQIRLNSQLSQCVFFLSWQCLVSEVGRDDHQSVFPSLLPRLLLLPFTLPDLNHVCHLLQRACSPCSLCCWTQVHVPEAQWGQTNQKVRVWSRRWFTTGPSKENVWFLFKGILDGFQGRVFKSKILDEGCRVVTFFWLAGGDVTGRCSRTLALGITMLHPEGGLSSCCCCCCRFSCVRLCATP